MNEKQDRVYTRTASDLERKYNFGKTFAEMLGLISDTRKDLDSVESTLRDEITKQATSIIRDTESIVLSATESQQKTTDDLKTQITEITSTMEQQSDQFEFRFTNVKGELQNVSDALVNSQELLETYIRFKGALIELGKVGNKFTAELDNERLAFLENGVQIAYISNNKLYITDAEVSEHLAMGKADRGFYDLYVRVNGHLTLKRRR
jgi:uncharacterized phage infection (PIP) family protein YhgE